MNRLVKKTCEACGKDLGMVYYTKLYCKECAEIRNRESRTASRKRMLKTVIAPDKLGERWSKDEERFIQENYVPGVFTIVDICRCIGRPWGSVKNKVRNMQLNGKLKASM